MSLYALFYLASFVLFVALSSALLKARGANGKLRNTVTLAYLIGMMLGAHALYYTLCERTLANTAIREFYSSLSNGQGGLLANLSGLRGATTGAGGLWGGPLFVMLTLLPLVVTLRLDLRTKRDLLDTFAVSFPYALALAKVGCFVNGCCHGVEGSGPLYIQFTWVPKNSACYMKSCFPTQLLDLLIYLSIATVLLALFLKPVQRGKLILWFVLLYSVGRFASEFTRGDDVGGKLYGLSPVQVVLVASCAASILLLLQRRLFDRILSVQLARTGTRTEDASASAPTDRSLERSDRQLLVAVFSILLALFVFPILALPLLLLGVLFLVRLRPALRDGSSARQWSRAFNTFAYWALDLLFVTVFLLTSLVPFYISYALVLALAVAILNKFFESLALQERPQQRGTAVA
jgi:prolipoprotein diacylglyceryltransferase